MRKFILAMLLPALLSSAAFAESRNEPDNKTGQLATVPYVDLKRYAGRWFEIARLPNKFQDQCVGNTTATYNLKERGEIEVINQCLTKKGNVDDAKGKAKIVDTRTNAKLAVRFAPGALSFLPGVWGDYWVIALEPNYQYAVVGHPDRKYLWVLSRSPQMDDVLYQNILRNVEKMGYNANKVMKTAQGMETMKGTIIQ